MWRKVNIANKLKKTHMKNLNISSLVTHITLFGRHSGGAQSEEICEKRSSSRFRFGTSMTDHATASYVTAKSESFDLFWSHQSSGELSPLPSKPTV